MYQREREWESQRESKRAQERESEWERARASDRGRHRIREGDIY